MLTLFIRQRLRSEHCGPNPSGLCDRVPVDQFSWLAHNPQGEAWFIPLKSVKTEPKHIHLGACLLLQMHTVTRILSGTRRGNLTNGGANTLIHKRRISTKKKSAFRNLPKNCKSFKSVVHVWCLVFCQPLYRHGRSSIRANLNNGLAVKAAKKINCVSLIGNHGMDVKHHDLLRGLQHCGKKKIHIYAPKQTHSIHRTCISTCSWQLWHRRRICRVLIKAEPSILSSKV